MAEPVTPADLAEYTAVSRASKPDALLRLEENRLIVRTRDEADRRVYQIRLPRRGQIATEKSLMHYLKTVGAVARYLDDETRPTLLSAYTRLEQGAIDLTT